MGSPHALILLPGKSARWGRESPQTATPDSGRNARLGGGGSPRARTPAASLGLEECSLPAWASGLEQLSLPTAALGPWRGGTELLWSWGCRAGRQTGAMGRLQWWGGMGRNRSRAMGKGAEQCGAMGRAAGGRNRMGMGLQVEDVGRGPPKP